MPILRRLTSAWNAFFNKDPTKNWSWNYDAGPITNYRPDRLRLSRGNERSMVTSIYNRIALDVAAITIEHVKLDGDGRFSEIIPSGLNTCLTLSTNRDQTARAFWVDVVMSMFDEGCIAIIPVDTDDDPEDGEPGSFDILTMRVGKVVEWRPKEVKVRAYNENSGIYEEIILEKEAVAIVENPLYAIMNEPNSILQRLLRKLYLLDAIDEQSGAGKLDLIIQFPGAIRSESQKIRADERRKEIERQLAGSKYGIAWADGTEKIVQLNRSVENNLMNQIEYLTTMLYNQLGMTQAVFDGTADEQTMLTYYNRTIEPILAAIVDEMKRKFLTKTARTRGQSIMYFRDPFRLVPVGSLAELADKFTRNEIMTSNEIRQIVGMKPSDDPKADELINSNLSQAKQDMRGKEEVPVEPEKEE